MRFKMMFSMTALFVVLIGKQAVVSQEPSMTTKQETPAKTPPTKSRPKPQQLVLFYTPMWGHVPWRHLKNTRDTHAFTHVDEKTPCKATNCRISYDKRDLDKSDAVIFHARDMPSLSHLQEISKRRNKNQRWVFWTYENPYYVWLDLPRYNHFFNWTMTYRRDSDISAPYGNYRLLSPNERPKNKDLKNYAQGKDKLVGWMVSNCQSPRRIIADKLLANDIDVTVLGKCGIQFGQRNPCESVNCESILKRCKFYLSFENINCIDYVTEKYWGHPFRYDMVPVVFGPRNYDSKTAIPGSYINVRDFSSIKHLARYLKYLDKNDTAYNEYFQWKLRYKLEDVNPWNCQMCEHLNNPTLPVMVKDDLATYWGEETSCEDSLEIVNKL